jgi:predicted enzyme related to lactoylglutathione lyase
MEHSGGNVTIFVKNLDEAIRFYEEVVGLKQRVRYGDGWAEVEAPGLTIGLHPLHGRPRPTVGEGGVSIGFGVTDWDAAMQQLERNGVKVSTRDGADRRIANFSDPDGNPLYLIETGGRKNRSVVT